MENKNVGFLILGIAVLMFFIVLIFNSVLKEALSLSCGAIGHGGYSCPAFDSLTKQTYLSFSIVGLLGILGFFLVFSKPKEKIVLKKIKEKVEVQRKPVNYNNLNNEEKVVVSLLETNGNGMFQSDLVEKSGFDKVKITRILDKLEGRQLTERKRRGMNNFVVLR